MLPIQSMINCGQQVSGRRGGASVNRGGREWRLCSSERKNLRIFMWAQFSRVSQSSAVANSAICGRTGGTAWWDLQTTVFDMQKDLKGQSSLLTLVKKKQDDFYHNKILLYPGGSGHRFLLRLHVWLLIFSMNFINLFSSLFSSNYQIWLLYLI